MAVGVPVGAGRCGARLAAAESALLTAIAPKPSATTDAATAVRRRVRAMCMRAVLFVMDRSCAGRDSESSGRARIMR